MERQRKTAKNTSHNRRGRVKESKRSKRNRFGTVCIVIQTIASIALMIVLNLLGMIPLKYLILVAVLLFFFWCITLNSQVARRKKGTFGKVFSLLLTFCLFIGSYYVAEANDMISRITGGNYKVDKMIVAVRADDPAETLEDAADYTFGVQFSKGSDNMQAAVSDTVSAKNEITPDTKLLGIVGQFDAFRWGVQRSIGAHLIEYGDPDGLGDLQRQNQIAIRAEIVYGIGIMDQAAFTKIVKAEG